MKKFLLLSTLILAMVSCQKEEPDDTTSSNEPKACFTYTVNGTSVRFNSDCSKNAQSWDWQFGQNQTSIAANPVFDYGTVGTFQATLRVTSASGKTNTTTEEVTIDPVCVTCTVYVWDGEDPGTEYSRLEHIEDFCGTQEQADAFCDV